MPARHFPVRPNLDQLKHQAKDLFKALRSGDSSAIADLESYHPGKIEANAAKLADAQLVLAHSYGIASWPRLVQACQLVDAIWRDDVAGVRNIVLKHPHLLKEMARGTEECNWGPPMSYAANLGRDQIIRMLHDLGATDHARALDRAALQSKIETARMIHSMMGSPRPPANLLGGPAYTLSASGTALLQLHPGYEIPGLHEYRDVTPRSWGERFHFKKLVSGPAIQLLIQRGGKP
jgi:hypothetical protein